MSQGRSIFASRAGIIVVGLILGGLAATLQKQGNPTNMGVCVACFTRDISGALGLHRAGPVQYLRPEIPAFCLGALLAALLFREFRPRAGSAPATRFLLGTLAAFGALIFLGCPWRALLRLAGGDWNALLGLAGLIVGIIVGTLFIRGGFNLGRSHPGRAVAGLALPFLMAVLLALCFYYPHVGDNAALFRSTEGPGSKAAPLLWSTGVGLIIGFLAQRTRFCTVGGFRDALLMRDFHLLSGVIAFAVAAFAMNMWYGQFHPGFTLGLNPEGKPIQQFAAHTVHWLNFAGLALAGLAFTLAGGCPGRQVFLSGEGDGDAAMFVLGMFVGAALAHNFLAVGNAAMAPTMVVIGLVVALVIGFAGREKLALAR
jgi:uncharacterized protein